MSTEDNVINMSEWQGSDEPVEMTEAEYDTAMTELLSQVNLDELGRTISGVLEFLTMRAIHDGPFYIQTDDKQAIAVFAANEDAQTLFDALPKHFKNWEDEMETPDEPDFLTDRDPGDEQDEPTA